MTAILAASDAALPFAISTLIVGSIVLLAAIVALLGIRHWSAARHAVLLSALLTVGLSPLIVVLVRQFAAPNLVLLSGLVPFERLSGDPSTRTLHNDNQSLLQEHFSPAAVLVCVWAAGVVLSLARLFHGLHVLSKVRHSARSDARIVPLRARLAAVVGEVPEICISERVGVPLAMGPLRPLVLLPSSFLTKFNDDQIFQVLLHECAHVVRRDALVGTYQRLLAGALWFHPLIYVANRLLDCAREEMCDNYVLQTVASTEYSRTLLAVAQSFTMCPAGCFAPALARSARYLEHRVAALLDPRRNTMTRLTKKQVATILMGFVGGALVLSAFAASPKSDEEGVRATVTDYIQGYYTGNAARMEKSLHPHYLKHVISEPYGKNGKLRMSEKSGLQMVQDVRIAGGPPTELSPSDRKEEIAVLDISGDVASAKLVTDHWVDYITLCKWNGEWKIVSVLLREHF